MTDFPIENLPYGMFRRTGEPGVRLGVRFGDEVLDVSTVFGIRSLEEVMSMRPAQRIELRQRVADFLIKDAEPFLLPLAAVEMRLPCAIGDYTDFYASIDHATNVGRMFRPTIPYCPTISGCRSPITAAVRRLS